jgi:hypothetical protein
MGLMVLAQVIRELIADGEYLVECIEQRDHGKVAVSFALRSRAQPYTVQIETTDNKMAGLFRALLGEEPARTEQPALVKIGSHAVPVVEVDSLPADAAKTRRRRKQASNDADGGGGREPRQPTRQGRNSGQQLALVPQDPSKDLTTAPPPARRRRTARVSGQGETP